MVDPVKAAEIAAEATEQKIETAQKDAEELVEIAADRAERAEQAAATIMEGALETERGKRIGVIERWLDEHNQLHQSLQTEIAGVKATLTDISARLPPMIVTPPIPEPPPPASPTPKPPSTPGPVEMVLAEQPAPENGGDARPAQKTKKRERYVL